MRNLFFSFSLLISLGLFSQTWLQKNSLPASGRYASFSFAISDMGYVGGGQISSGGNYTNDFWEYNPEGIWTQKANYAGGPVYAASAFTIANLGYVCCGYNGQCKTDVWAYNPITNGWIQKSSFSGSARYGAFSFSIGDKGYLGMGSWGAAGSFFNDFWEYNSTNNTWTQKNSYNTTGRNHGIGFSINNKGYAGLGTDNGNGHFVNEFYEYNPINDTWVQKANFPSARGSASCFTIAEIAYVGLGVDNSGLYNNDLWKYDPIANNWTSLVSAGITKRQASIGFAINGKGYFGLGITSTGTYLNDLWEFTPATFAVNEINTKDFNIYFENNQKHLILRSEINEIVTVKIYTINGKEIFNFKANTNSINPLNVNVKGTYIYNVEFENSTKSGKIIVL